jgi:hypothetical protein
MKTAGPLAEAARAEAGANGNTCATPMPMPKVGQSGKRGG